VKTKPDSFPVVISPLVSLNNVINVIINITEENIMENRKTENRNNERVIVVSQFENLTISEKSRREIRLKLCA
jgi:hypothetical protein